MYDELVKRLRDSEHQIDCCLCDRDCCYTDGKVHGKCIIIEAADAIEKLAAFKAQITDGRFYVYKLGTLFELRHDPRDLTVKFQYPEPPKEET